MSQHSCTCTLTGAAPQTAELIQPTRMVFVLAPHRHNGVELRPVYPRLSVFDSGGRHDGLEDVVGVDVLVGVEEAHAHVLLLIIAGVLVPLELQHMSYQGHVRVRGHARGDGSGRGGGDGVGGVRGMVVCR